MKLNKGTNDEVVYNSLLPHEYTRVSTLERKLKMKRSTLSSTLTRLRKAGLAEYTGSLRDMRYKRHPIDKPLFPPQENKIKRDTREDKEIINVQKEIDNIIVSLGKIKSYLAKNCLDKKSLSKIIEQI